MESMCRDRQQQNLFAMGHMDYRHGRLSGDERRRRHTYCIELDPGRVRVRAAV